MEYADILKNVDPLRRELSSLESDAEDTRMRGEEVEKVIGELEKSIAQYKEDYARLISEANAIKTDLEKVETKVGPASLCCVCKYGDKVHCIRLLWVQVARSKALLNSLGEEQDRWKSGSDVFKSQMSTIVGDVLLTSAFMAYAGYFDQSLRHSLYSSWSQHLQDASVAYRSDLAIFEVCIPI